MTPAVISDVLPGVQREYSRLIDDRLGAAFLAAHMDNPGRGTQGAARVRSCSGRVASAWL